MLGTVCERLVSLGYDIPYYEGKYMPAATDEMMLTFIHEKEVNIVKGECNTDSIPDELEAVVVDHIVGEFLLSKKNLGQLELNDIDFSGAVQTLNVGDTKVEFAEGGSQAEMFDCLVSVLRKPIDFSDYRRIRW